MCFSTAKWKREQVKDHKFDFIDVDSFEHNTLLSWTGYLFVMLTILKSVLVYIADVWTAGILLIFDRWSSAIQPAIPFSVSKWIFVACIFASFALLLWDIKKARFIRKTRDISFAFTNVIAYKSYILTSHAYYCFFSKINNSRKCTDRIAFFVFFAFKGWKRLIFAEAPRQAVSAFTLYSFVPLVRSKKYYDLSSYGVDTVQRLVVALMAFSLFIFIFSALRIIIAALLYIPLICIIRGNLKEFCCHKIDKRIGELLEKERKKRINKMKKSKKKKQVFSVRPTLPKICESDPSLPPYAHSSVLPYSKNFIPPTDMKRSNSPDPMMVGPPPYVSRTTTPNYGSGPLTPNYGQPNQSSLYRSNMADYSNQPYPNDGPPHLNSEISYNNLGYNPEYNPGYNPKYNPGPVSEPIPVIRQNQHDPIIAPQPILSDMGYPRQPYPPNPSQPNFSPMNHSNIISPERFGNNLEPVSEPIPVVGQIQQNSIIPPQAQVTSQPVLSDMSHPQQPYPNHGFPQQSPFPPNRLNVTAFERPYNNLTAASEPIPFVGQNQQDPVMPPLPINRSNTTAPERSYNNFTAVSEPIPFARQNQYDPIMPPHATVVPNMGHPQQPYHNQPPQPFSVDRSNVPVIRQNQYEHIIEGSSINNNGYVPNISNGVLNDYYNNSALIPESNNGLRPESNSAHILESNSALRPESNSTLIPESNSDDSRYSYSPYIGYYQNAESTSQPIDKSDETISLNNRDDKYSPSSSIGSNTGKTIPSKYKEAEKGSTVNNYVQQNGSLNTNEQNNS